MSKIEDDQNEEKSLAFFTNAFEKDAVLVCSEADDMKWSLLYAKAAIEKGRYKQLVIVKNVEGTLIPSLKLKGYTDVYIFPELLESYEFVESIIGKSCFDAMVKNAQLKIKPFKYYESINLESSIVIFESSNHRDIEKMNALMINRYQTSRMVIIGENVVVEVGESFWGADGSKCYNESIADIGQVDLMKHNNESLHPTAVNKLEWITIETEFWGIIKDVDMVSADQPTKLSEKRQRKSPIIKKVVDAIVVSSMVQELSKYMLGKIASETLYDSHQRIVINRKDLITTDVMSVAEREGLLMELILQMTLTELEV